MAEGDKYFNCNNTNIALAQVLRNMIIKDAEGNPQWRTNSSDPTPPWPPIEEGYEYVAKWENIAQSFSERDGIVVFETDQGKIRMIGGWNGTWVPTTRPEQWESSDNITYTQISDAPWAGRHNFAHGQREDGFFWIWGGDDQLVPGTGQTDVWKYSTATGWVQVTANWGAVAGNRYGHGFCVHKVGAIEYMYMFGGTIQDCVRSVDGITWTKVSDLPAALTGYLNGYACSHRGELFILGGQGLGGQNKVYKSSDHGATWIAMPDLANDGFTPTNGQNNTSFWCRVISWSDRLFYLAGASDVGNVTGMWYSEDGAATWKKMYSYPVQPSHARGINHFQGDIAIVSGNNARTSARVYKIPKVLISDKAIYSLRKVNPAYNGPCIRFRHVFGALTDIGFIGNDLNTAALITASGGLNGTVAIWYDQSGNGLHITQPDAAKQPFIYLSGSGGLQTLNGKPAIVFNATTQGFEPASTVDCGNHYVISVVASVSADSRTIVGLGPSFEDYGMQINIAGANIAHRSQNPDTKYYLGVLTKTFALNTQYLFQVHKNRMSGKHCVNGDALATITSSTLERYDTSFSFNRIGREGVPFTGKMQEVWIKSGYHEFDQDLAIKASANGYFNIYP